MVIGGFSVIYDNKSILQYSRYILLSLFYSLYITAVPRLDEILIDEYDDIEKFLFEKKSIIEANEWKELKIPDLIARYDRTLTKMGKYGLYCASVPTAQYDLLLERTSILSNLAHDQDLYTQLGDQLKEVALLEKDLLSYWDDTDTVNTAAKNLFFNEHIDLKTGFSPLDGCIKKYKSLSKYLNTSKVALEVSVMCAMLYNAKNLLGGIFLDGLLSEFSDSRISLDNTFSFKRGLTRNFSSLINDHYPWHMLYGPDKQNTDRYKLLQNECSRGELGTWHFILSLRDGSFSDRVFITSLLSKGWWNWFCSKHNYFLYYPALLVNGIVKKSASMIGTVAPVNSLDNLATTGLVDLQLKQLPPIDMHNKGMFKNPLNWITPLGFTIGRDLWWVTTLKDSFNNMKNQLTNLETVRMRIRGIGLLLSKGKQIYTWMQKNNPIFVKTKSYMVLDAMYGQQVNTDNWMMKIYKQCTSAIVLVNSSVFYSRGAVLLAYKTINDHKDELIDFMRAIGELDAYYSLATLVNESVSTQKEFSIPHFVATDKPYISINDGWYPLMAQNMQPIKNSVTLGDNMPRAVIITGPNACGKSLFIKMIGLNALLAQSWGIVPAREVTLNPYHCIGTCLVSEENAAKDLSTFAAEEIRMSRLAQKINAFTQPVLLVIDEPYRGTVHETAEQCLIDFCNDSIIPYLQCSTVVATHVKKPIELSDTYPTIFTNKHMNIDFIDDGGIARTFKVLDGPAYWWFNDTDKRNAFIKWFKNYYKKHLN